MSYVELLRVVHDQRRREMQDAAAIRRLVRIRRAAASRKARVQGLG